MEHFISDFHKNSGQNGVSVTEVEKKRKIKIREAMGDFEKFCLALETKYSSNEVKPKISDGNRQRIIASCKDGIKWLKGTRDINLHDIEQQKSKILELEDEIIKNKSDGCLVECPDDTDEECPNSNAGNVQVPKRTEFHLDEFCQKMINRISIKENDLLE